MMSLNVPSLDEKELLSGSNDTNFGGTWLNCLPIRQAVNFPQRTNDLQSRDIDKLCQSHRPIPTPKAINLGFRRDSPRQLRACGATHFQLGPSDILDMTSKMRAGDYLSDAKQTRVKIVLKLLRLRSSVAQLNSEVNEKRNINNDRHQSLTGPILFMGSSTGGLIVGACLNLTSLAECQIRDACLVETAVAGSGASQSSSGQETLLNVEHWEMAQINGFFQDAALRRRKKMLRALMDSSGREPFNERSGSADYEEGESSESEDDSIFSDVESDSVISVMSVASSIPEFASIPLENSESNFLSPDEAEHGDYVLDLVSNSSRWPNGERVPLGSNDSDIETLLFSEEVQEPLLRELDLDLEDNNEGNNSESCFSGSL